MTPKHDNEELTINLTQAICNLDVLVDSKAPKYTSPTKEVPQGKRHRARSGLRRKQSSKHTSGSTTEASKSQSSHSKKENKSSSAIDTSPSHPSPPTLVVGEMHKEAQLAAGGPTSLGDTRHDALADFIAEADLGISAPKDPILNNRHLLQSQKKELELSREIKELKKHIKDIEIELPRDLKEIPSKLETFTSTISNLSFQVAKLKNIQLELPAEFPDLPHLASLVQKKLKTLDSLPGLLKTNTNTLNRFFTMVENASGATTTCVPSANKAAALHAKEEKDADTNLKNKLVDLLGIYIVTQYYNKKLLYKRYCEKMKKRRQSSKIINCDVLTKKGPISLKVYKEDRTTKVIKKFKASDLPNKER
uniref:Uncharacterized protein n=1 Tax=Tanacetum cinerariifolium TaxID=118510 RepID=A0A699GLW2_TANCI|nr:hypothetical protein [Tanacetum cinerariifolium]